MKPQKANMKEIQPWKQMEPQKAKMKAHEKEMKPQKWMEMKAQNIKMKRNEGIKGQKWKEMMIRKKKACFRRQIFGLNCFLKNDYFFNDRRRL